VAFVDGLLSIPVPEDEAAERKWRRKVTGLVNRIRHTKAWTLR
jgi:hypothetical protein